jgi:hypothetical protein
VLLALTIFSLLIPGLYPLAVEVQPPPPGDWYLGNASGQIEQFAVWNNLDGAADSLRKADVLFVGDSLMLFGFQDQLALRQYFAARGLRHFVLAFGGEHDEVFAERIIRKFDLHPKWVIVDAAWLFGREPSAAASKAMSSGYWEGWKFRFEAETSFGVQRRIHTVLPYLGLPQWETEPDWIWYRSKSDGAMWLAAARGGYPGPVPDTADLAFAKKVLRRPPLGPEEIAAAELFRKEMQSRGARLVLTWIPPNAGENSTLLATALDVPLVGVAVPGLSTVDGQHLDRESSSVFSKAYLGALDQVLRPAQK